MKAVLKKGDIVRLPQQGDKWDKLVLTVIKVEGPRALVECRSRDQDDLLREIFPQCEIWTSINSSYLRVLSPLELLAMEG